MGDGVCLVGVGVDLYLVSLSFCDVRSVVTRFDKDGFFYSCVRILAFLATDTDITLVVE